MGGMQALLLVLVGGVTKEMDDGMKLRGDIHACLMGAWHDCKMSVIAGVPWLSNWQDIRICSAHPTLCWGNMPMAGLSCCR
jgi:MCM P-loop domain